MKQNQQPAWTGSRSGFTKLIAWQKSYQLVLDVYRATERMPRSERFALAAQTKRAAVSIPCNLAEGWSRGSTADYLRFMHIAKGSAAELQTQIWLARDLGFLHTDAKIDEKIDESIRLLNGLIRSLDGKIA